MNLQLIPAIDLIDGKCVRLTHGDYDTKKIYNSDPLDQAKIFEDKGIQRLHIVDLDGAKVGKPQHLQTLEKIASQTNLTIDFGGGIRDAESVESILSSGAKMVSVGSIAVKKPKVFEDWLSEFGGKSILLAADVRGEKLLTDAWKNESEFTIFEFIENWKQKGLTQFFCTDITKDGALEGLNADFYGVLKAKFPDLTVIASGGVTSQDDLIELDKLGVDGAIVGKAIYEERILI
ncbi:1-(5-phosphoribosyl)-5-[(5-phosphoribosylamino)methylideneamino]imidazole-4-carboxamide isomerase [Bernardetia sp.]|uniref:1-(5-phosphoribosyl)-5-[(5- phosphoribosylamino)methylideneamino]imidazole-4- carboxamide isomerase n=1 Tax=Bernardetia sp. TaxID=1937974 RepID=UPI0025B7F036|nr:1-(5-phosphoribosyl)-5-[(5-phosphoribosylamino)methylideneamino]imidazole-4-carboxamide isomerase [Bernardetia sp.]